MSPKSKGIDASLSVHEWANLGFCYGRLIGAFLGLVLFVACSVCYYVEQHVYQGILRESAVVGSGSNAMHDNFDMLFFGQLGLLVALTCAAVSGILGGTFGVIIGRLSYRVYHRSNNSSSRKSFARRVTWTIVCTMMMLAFSPSAAGHNEERPNILFAIADDWGWPHAGAYGDPVVRTPAFDAIAQTGVLFTNAFVSSPSCTPSRSAILAGQFHWRLQDSANLYGAFPDSEVTFPELLAQSGYEVGVTGKGWGPGKPQTPGRQLIGPRHKSFEDFYSASDANKPFFFWLGTSDPHRPFELNSGQTSGMDLAKVRLPACFPDCATVRGDVADYYVEVQRFDTLVGRALRLLEEKGQLGNTIVVMTSDHGMPFPRCKSNLYDTGVRVPLAVSWPGKIPGPRRVTDFASLADLATTLLEFAGLQSPPAMIGNNLTPILRSNESGRVVPERDHMIFGKERHVPSQEAPDLGGYPSRAIRTDDYLLIHNYEPTRWPNGTPDFENAAVPGTWYGDTDNGPTKTYMIENRNADVTHQMLYEIAFGKRPEFELYDLKSDPNQLNNVASQPAYAQTLQGLSEQLSRELRQSGDPRELGDGAAFDQLPYSGGSPKHPSWKKQSR